MTSMDPWFLNQIKQITDEIKSLAAWAMTRRLRTMCACEEDGRVGRAHRERVGLGRCDGSPSPAHEAGSPAGLQAGGYLRRGVQSYTPYLYSCYDEEDEAAPTTRRKNYYPGQRAQSDWQGIEFDYCCCHAAFALREDGYETIMVNCNPETVSTDYDTSDRLYFEPLTWKTACSL